MNITATVSAVAALLTVVGGGGLFYSRRAAKASADNAVVAGALNVLGMYEKFSIKAGEDNNALHLRVNALELALVGAQNLLKDEQKRCDKLERAVRAAGIQIT